IAGLICPIWRGGCRKLVLPRQRRDKSVTTAREGDDIALAGTAIVQRLSQRRDMDPERGLFDESAPASPGGPLLFRDRLAGAFDQCDQNVERTTTEAHRLLVVEQHSLRRDQPERSEDEGFVIHGGTVLPARGFI